MKLLILGGTAFLGRHLVEVALRAGHEVTLFNRGATNPDLFAGQVEKVTGDRNSDLTRLAGQRFDACIDTSGYLPGALKSAGAALKDAVDRYVFISSISVYPQFPAGLNEAAQLAELPEGYDTTVYEDRFYGALKVACEREIEAAMPGRVLHVRSGLIVGPYDPTHRFTYWPARIASGGRFAAPVSARYPIQMIHAADQARWILHMLDIDQMGAFNVSSDNGSYTLGDVIQATRELTGSQAEPVWLPDEFLLDADVGPWMELPLWLPGDAVNMNRVSCTKALESGLQFMPLSRIIESTLAWHQRQPEQTWPAGLSAEREAQLLTAWQNRLKD